MKSLPETLAFRRQFLLTSSSTDRLPGWTSQSFEGITLYAHPELGVTVHKDEKTGVRLLLLGFAIDRDRPEHTDADILNRLAQARSHGGWWDEFIDLTGRFVLVVFDGDRIEVMHDPCGLRTVEYTVEGGGFHAASQSELLAYVAPVSRGARYREYAESDYSANVWEDHLTADTTLFDGVDRLVPNHVLTVTMSSAGESTVAGEQERFWPTGAAPVPGSAPNGDVASDALAALRASIDAVSRRFPLSQPLTAGLDSRMIFAAARPFASKIWFYTMLYRWLTPASPDVSAPGNLLRTIGQPHHILNAKNKPPQEFIERYVANSPMAHANDATIAYGLLRGYPADRVAVKGNAAELIKCYYNQDGERLDVRSADDIIALIPRWETVPFIADSIRRWYDKTASLAADHGWELDLLFHWEHQLGTWQAQSQLEWDIVQEVYTPFADRRLVTRVLQSNPHDRKPGSSAVIEEIIRLGGDDLLNEPINANPRAERIRNLTWRAKGRLGREIASLRGKSASRR